MNRRRKWADEEIDFIERNYSEMTGNAIGAVLGVSGQSVRDKANGLGLKKMIFWTESEMKYLTENYYSMDNAQIAKKLNKTSAQVSYKARGMNLKKEEIWSEEDISLLRKLYPHMSPDELSDVFNKSYNSIKYKAQKLKIKKNHWWTESEIKILKDNYALNYDNVGKLLPNRTSKSIKKKAHELNLKINREKIFEIRNENLKGRLTCDTTSNPNFKNQKDLRYACRNRLTTWVKMIRVIYDDKCIITGDTENTTVHHLRSFRDIFYEVLKKYEANGFIKDDNLVKCCEINGESIVDAFINEVRNEHRVEDGVLISTEIHDKFHNKYGTKYCTREQFYEFALTNYGVDVKEVIMNGGKKENNG